MNNLSNKLSYVAVTFIMAAIIVSFALTGFEGFNNSAGQVADVGGLKVTSSELNRAVQFNIDQYSRMMQGKSLTKQQIKQFRIKESALQTLITQKHMLNLANSLELGAGKKHVKNEIKEYQMFQSGGKFDVTKYKQLLKANKISPIVFEGQMIDQVKSKKLSKLVTSLQDSKSFTAELLKLKNLKMEATVVSINKEAMTKNLSIKKSDIKAFIKDEKNKGTIASLYKTYEAEFKAKSPKKKAKSLVKAQNELVKKHLQKIDRKSLTAFNDKLAGDIKGFLEKGQTKKIKKLSKKYGFIFEEKYDLTVFNPSYKGSNFKEEEVFGMFKSSDKSKILSSSSAVALTYVKANNYASRAAKAEDLAKELKSSGQKNARLLQSELVSHQEQTTKVTTSVNL